MDDQDQWQTKSTKDQYTEDTDKASTLPVKNVKTKSSSFSNYSNKHHLSSTTQ